MVNFSPQVNVTPRPCVLIIDDEDNVRMALRAMLQGEYDILEATSAEEGIEILKHHHADLVTLDVLMPGRSGLDALRHIRESNENSALPVIMITGHASVDSACEALRLGATDYLQKPFGVDELKTSIRNGLSRQDCGPLPSLKNGKNGLLVRTTKVPREGISSMNETDKESLMRLGKASAAFVHDLASPLQVLTILTSLCAAKMAEPASPKRDKELCESAQQMEQILSWSTELLKNWRTIAMPNALSKELLDVDTLLSRVMELVQPYAKLNQVKLTRAPLQESLQVEADRMQIERALVNLCLNGIKASMTRGRTLSVSVIAFNHDVVFRFTDSGQGFSPTRMKEVLDTDPFCGGTGTKRRGLGLFIADWIAMNHGGKLQFISDQGQGTTVEFFIPA